MINESAMHAVQDDAVSLHTARYACVAQYLLRSLACFGHVKYNIASLARFLDILVLPTDANPWGLRTTTDPEAVGVMLSDAQAKISAFLSRVDGNLTFRHISLNAIWGGMVEDLAMMALQRGCSLGLGYDYSCFVECMGNMRLTRHVSIVLKADAQALELEEPFMSHSARVSRISWPNVWSSAAQIGGGFWLIGRASDLVFDCAPRIHIHETHFYKG